MTELSPGSADYRKAEQSLLKVLREMEADERAIHVASERSFLAWAKPVVEMFLQGLGYSAGVIAGALARLYRSVSSSLASGFRAGFRRGLGD